jgi:hypothetical protein
MLLYQLVADHHPEFRDRRVAEEGLRPGGRVTRSETYLEHGSLEHTIIWGASPVRQACRPGLAFA